MFPRSVEAFDDGQDRHLQRHHHQAHDGKEHDVAALPPAEHERISRHGGDDDDEERGRDGDLEGGPERVERTPGGQPRRHGGPHSPGKEVLVVATG